MDELLARETAFLFNWNGRAYLKHPRESPIAFAAPVVNLFAILPGGDLILTHEAGELVVRRLDDLEVVWRGTFTRHVKAVYDLGERGILIRGNQEASYAGGHTADYRLIEIDSAGALTVERKPALSEYLKVNPHYRLLAGFRNEEELAWLLDFDTGDPVEPTPAILAALTWERWLGSRELLNLSRPENLTFPYVVPEQDMWRREAPREAGLAEDTKWLMAARKAVLDITAETFALASLAEI